MGTIRHPQPAKLFFGMLSSDPSLFDACARILVTEYGPVDLESEILPWNITNYYREELGDRILRKFIFLERLIDPSELPRTKIFTNNVESTFATREIRGLHRRINLDPGYLTQAKVVLATTKDFAHRIYIGDGIYAEATLRYSSPDRGFVPFDHTYPDYRTEQYTAIFNKARENLRSALKRNGKID